MQLASGGRLSLDAPLWEAVPEWSDVDVGIGAAADRTMRQRLSHSSGLIGDYFADFGVGDGCRASYARSLSYVSLLHDGGEAFGYCNSGYILAGHVIEMLAGLPSRGWSSTASSAPQL